MSVDNYCQYAPHIDLICLRARAYMCARKTDCLKEIRKEICKQTTEIITSKVQYTDSAGLVYFFFFFSIVVCADLSSHISHIERMI